MKMTNSNGVFNRYGKTALALQQAQIHFGKGSICVMREYRGKPVVLKIENQHHFKEWVGCFSVYCGE